MVFQCDDDVRRAPEKFRRPRVQRLGEPRIDDRRVKARRVQVNMMEGKMLLECEASDREALEAWLKGEGFHYEWLMRIEFESESGPLAPVS